MTSREASFTAALDASVAINLAILDALGLLGRLDGWAFVITPEAEGEVLRPELATRLQVAMESGAVRQERVPHAALATFAGRASARSGSSRRPG